MILKDLTHWFYGKICAPFPDEWTEFLNIFIYVIQGFGEDPEGKNHSEDPGVDGKVLIKCIFRKWDGRHRLD